MPAWPKPLPERLDHGPGRRRRRRRAGPHLGRAAPEDADRRREGREPQPAAHEMLQARPAGAGVRPGRQPRAGLGRPGPGLRLAAERARHPRRPQGLRLARRQRRQRRPDPEVHRATASSCCRSASRARRRTASTRRRLGTPGRHATSIRRPTRSTSPTATATTASSCSTPTPAPSSGMWGAYGKPPTDEKLPPYDPAAAPAQQFRNPVHCVRIARDGLVYVCDRHQQPHPGVPQGRHLREGILRREEHAAPTARSGTWSSGPTQSETLPASTPTAPTTRSARSCATPARWSARFGRNGRKAGDFHWVHNLAIDFEGQRLHDRGRHRQAGAEIPVPRRHGAGKRRRNRHDPEVAAGFRKRSCSNKQKRTTQNHRALARPRPRRGITSPPAPAPSRRARRR